MANPKMNELLAIVEIDGTQLTKAQAIAVQMAVEHYIDQLTDSGLGDDKHGVELTSLYIERLKEVRALMLRQ